MAPPRTPGLPAWLKRLLPFGAYPISRRADIYETEAMLLEELAAIQQRRMATDAVQGGTAAAQADQLGLTALCLSGGGIRSAAFCLGVVQSLAERRLLNAFDYLSTVSGGGYVSGWLHTAIASDEAPGMEAFQAELAGPGFEPLRRLRAYTNYLTPQTGPLSFDIWAGIALYLQNTLLNWMVFTPLFLLMALAPVSYRTAIAASQCSAASDAAFLAGGGLALLVAAWRGCAMLPSHRAQPHPGFATPAAIGAQVVLPAILWSVLAGFSISYGLHRHGLPGCESASWLPPVQWVVPGLYAASLSAGYGLAWALRRNGTAAALYQGNAWRWLAATLCTAALAWLGLHLAAPGGALHQAAAARPSPNSQPFLPDTATGVALLFPLWLLGLHVLQTTFYVGFRREALLADLDREWLARFSGAVLQAGVGWTLLALCCLELPLLSGLLTQPRTPPASISGPSLLTVGAGTTLLGGAIAWLGKVLSSQIEALAARALSWRTLALGVLCVTFAAGVFAVAGGALQTGLGRFQLRFMGADASQARLLGLQTFLAAGFVALVFLFGGINVNRFSLHAFYRNRLARAFVGSARAARKPDPFTGFDPGDNPPLKDLSAAKAGQRLFPVINTTLNVTSTSNTAWAERKAESFTATPLRCGGASLRKPESGMHGNVGPLGAFVPTAGYAGMENRYDRQNRGEGVRLGSMITVSGAAASPNWGYHSSRLTAFVMTLFNVRLGLWLPNPATATASQIQIGKPDNSILAILNELVGTSSDTRQAVYLSDGGHFEDLGLYEMLRRRCRRIVLVDAGQDAGCTFFDLGNAIRKARIDLGAEVAMRPMSILSRAAIERDPTRAAGAIGFAVGDVTYPAPSGADGEPARGVLIYLKPSFLPGIPADVRAYGLSDPGFPHDSTLQQWFTESRFESYRKLGRWQMDQVMGDLPPGAVPLDGLFAEAEQLASKAGRSLRGHSNGLKEAIGTLGPLRPDPPKA